MPLPTPHANEAEQDFISRCAGDETMNKDFPDNGQRVAVCYRQWRDHHAKSARAALTDFRGTVAKATEGFGHG
jgi:hypothetical protein